jgi:hypothetical protein
MAQRLREQPRASGLAVRAGDAGDRQRLRGAAEESIGDGAGVMPEVRDRSDEHLCRVMVPEPPLHEL